MMAMGNARRARVATRCDRIVAVRSPNTLSGEIVVSEGEKASNGCQKNRK